MSSDRLSVTRFYLYPFLYDLILAYPIYTILFQSRGLDLMQISLLLMWWNISAMFLELPTGALADHWSRRKMLVAAPLIKMFCFITWYLADGSFALFALGFTFWSLGSSFVSGTLEAMLYDALAAHQRTGEYEKVRGRQRIFHHLAFGAASIAGGTIAYFHIDWNLLLSLPPLVGASIVALTMAEPPRLKHAADAHYLVHFKNAWHELRTNRTFRYILAYQMLAIGVLNEIDEYDPLYYTLVGVPLYALGWLNMTRALAESIGNLLAHRLKHLAVLEKVAPLAIGLLLLLVGLFPCKAMVALIILGYLILSPVHVIIEGRFQNSIQTASRATVLSGAGLLNTVSGIVLIAAFGAVARRWGLGAGYVFFGLILVSFSLCIAFRRPNGTKQP